MAKIFISYRREDSQYQADKLHSVLKTYVNDPRHDIFIDIDNIPFGVDFVEHLENKVAECEVLLAVIGDRWWNEDDTTGAPRIDNPKDFVRIEIAAALSRGVPVVPVLLDGASMPSEDALPEDLKPLARRNGIPVQRTSFDTDVARLVSGLPAELNAPPSTSRTKETQISENVVKQTHAYRAHDDQARYALQQPSGSVGRQWHSYAVGWFAIVWSIFPFYSSALPWLANAIDAPHPGFFHLPYASFHFLHSLPSFVEISFSATLAASLFLTGILILKPSPNARITAVIYSTILSLCFVRGLVTSGLDYNWVYGMQSGLLFNLMLAAILLLYTQIMCRGTRSSTS